MNDTSQNSSYIDVTADIISAYVSNNVIAHGELPNLISSIYSALIRLPPGAPSGSVEAPRPAVSIKKSVTNDYIICLEDGKRFKSLKRHLRTQYNMSPGEYREKWGLAPEYPMVAPNYAKARSNLAKQMGLGQQRRRVSRR